MPRRFRFAFSRLCSKRRNLSGRGSPREASRTFAQALMEMTDAQVAAIRARDLDRRVEKASFPYVKTLADFDFSFQPSIDRPVVEEPASLGFLERRENVVLVGGPGWARRTWRWRSASRR